MLFSSATALQNALNLVMSELFWMITGGLVGFAGIHAGIVADKRLRFRKIQGAAIALNFIPLYSTPACALISSISAAVCNISELDSDRRLIICGAINVCMFGILFTAGSGLSTVS